jgi:hypothetical protein
VWKGYNGSGATQELLMDSTIDSITSHFPFFHRCYQVDE